ncbi:MAG: hypothetical protein V3T24_03015, partial [Longimicrobiales bacterium]
MSGASSRFWSMSSGRRPLPRSRRSPKAPSPTCRRTPNVVEAHSTPPARGYRPMRPPDEQLELIRQGAVEILTEAEMAEQLKRAVEADRPLRVKAGFDPTAPDLHLGHTVL